jgi:predicted negative regulator of RcsB-dependent stress response
VDEYLTDEQEVDRAKQWLRENGAFLIAGVVLGLGGLFGWQQWENSRLAHAGEASLVWEQMTKALEGDRFNEVEETLALLESEYSETPYVEQARLAMARMHMDRSEPEQAAEQLRRLIAETSDVQMRRIGELRLAQTLLYQQQAQEALDVLGTGEEGAFASQYHELRGDAHYALGQAEQARVAYEQALATPEEGVINRDFVTLKLADVRGLIASSAATEAPIAEDPDSPPPALTESAEPATTAPAADVAQEPGS